MPTLECVRSELKEPKEFTILDSLDADLQMNLERWGLIGQRVLIKKGPWSSFIVCFRSEEFAIGPVLAKHLNVI
jgi:hypothetical protein